MGAGKTTIGREVAARIGRPFVDTDEEIEKRHGPIARIFEDRGEAEFRELEERVVAEALAGTELSVIALGGGAVLADATRERLRRSAWTFYVMTDLNEAWPRVEGSGRPLATDARRFAELSEEREELYDDVANAAAWPADANTVMSAALRVWVETDAVADHLTTLLLPDFSRLALIADGAVLDLHPPDLDPEDEDVGDFDVHRVPSGEAAKRLEVAQRLWDELRIDRRGVVVAFGGGTTTDVAGFVASTYLRGVRWMPVPTTLVGQVDAAIGGKTGIDISEGKNLVGAFHYPARVLLDPALLRTLPPEERRNGMAEVVKTGLLAGEPFWELEDEAMVSACAAYKCAVCLADPYERTGRRAILNLGHTFAHALEAASDYALPHGEAVALGLVAALRLSGQPTDVVEEILRPEPVRVDRDRAWAAMKRDKKADDGQLRLVLLEGPGKPVFPVEIPVADVRRALDRLIAD